MKPSPIPVGSFVQIEKTGLQAVLDRLQELGYRTFGPRVSEAAVVLDEIDSVEDLPIGYVDIQDAGKYRLEEAGNDSYFDYVVGPHSLKSYLFPSRETLLEGEFVDGTWRLRASDVREEPLAVIGSRSCDLHALAVQDKVFLGEALTDPGYRARREGLFVAAVNCRRAAATCFCHSMKTGPALKSGFDLALTEVEDHFVVEVGSDRGAEVVAAAAWSPCTMAQIEAAKKLPAELERRMHRRRKRKPDRDKDTEPQGRSLDVTDIRDLLVGNLDHPRWEAVAARCLACTNCTLVCPTCFCSTVEERSTLTGDRVRRERAWDSCFTAEHSYMNSGTVRQSTLSRYRQWLTHKLATWIDQFGTSGCVGCGRCITWCPVGIDLTEEVEAIRTEDSPAAIGARQ